MLILIVYSKGKTTYLTGHFDFDQGLGVDPNRVLPINYNTIKPYTGGIHVRTFNDGRFQGKGLQL